MKIEVHNRLDALSGAAAEWDRLAIEDARDGFFRTAGWYRAWMEHIRPDAEPFVLIARDYSGEIAGVAPLCRGRYQDLGFSFRRGITWAGRETVSGDFLDFVARHDRRAEVAAATLQYLWEHQREWSVLMLGELLQNGSSEAALQEIASRTGLPCRRQEERICPYIELPATFDDYLAGMSSSARYHVRRRRRDFEKRGGRLELYCDREIAQHLPTLTRLHEARWRKDNQPGTLGRAGLEPFLRAICDRPPAHSQIRLYMLTHEGRCVASLLAFHFGEAALYYQAGWDPDSAMAAHSPGSVVMGYSIEDAIRRGLRYYEFLRGDESYKSRWTSAYRTTATYVVGRSLLAREYLRVARLKEFVKERLRGHRALEVAEASSTIPASVE